MSTSHADADSSIGQRPGVKKAKHAKDDALDERTFEILLEGASKAKDPYALQCRFIVLVGGRLGLRAGEIAHMTEDWIDWRKRMIHIPRFQHCQKGRDGGICGYCKKMGEQKAEIATGSALDDLYASLPPNSELEPGAGRGLDAIVTPVEMEATMWSPKTEAAARSVPFDFDPRVELVVERFFEQYDEYPHSRQSVNRRVKRAATHTTGVDPGDVYPHALRATAATFHAARGLDILPLQAMFGWAKPSTAQVYVASSPENTARALHMIHSR